MYYRQKILLSLLEKCGGRLTNTDLEKLLFLYCQKTNSKHYDFFPYKYGGFSFVSYYDKRKLTDAGILVDVDKFELATSESFFPQLKPLDRTSIRNFVAQTKHLRGEKLVRTVYKEYPTCALRSEIASQILPEDEYAQVRKHWVVDNKPALLTIGYEGLSIDAYLNKLIMNNVMALVDVRANPVSRKYGFSKMLLQNNTEMINIKYIHIPELGISSRLRKNLSGRDSYRDLFDYYEKQILPNQSKSLEEIKALVRQFGRIALTCFEADHTMCHRHLLANSIHNTLGSKVPIRHL